MGYSSTSAYIHFLLIALITLCLFVIILFRVYFCWTVNATVFHRKLVSNQSKFKAFIPTYPFIFILSFVVKCILIVFGLVRLNFFL
jgi:hypothetical protein